MGRTPRQRFSAQAPVAPPPTKNDSAVAEAAIKERMLRQKALGRTSTMVAGANMNAPIDPAAQVRLGV